MPRKKVVKQDFGSAVDTSAVNAAVEDDIAKYAPSNEAKPKKRYPRIDVLERRLADPLGSGTSAQIRIKTPVETGVKGDTWHCRWIDSSQSGRLFDVIENKGWEKVQVSELFDQNDVSGLVASPDGGYVTRGDKGREILVKMPQSWWDRIHLAKVAAWGGAGKTKRQRKDELAESVASEVSRAKSKGAAVNLSDDEAGEMTRSLKGSVRLERGPMLDGPAEPDSDFI